jgi:hypothetical protein
LYRRLCRIRLTEPDTRSGLPSFSVETKRGDPRYRWFMAHHGATCWELDALSPVVLRDRVEQAILDRLDPAAWNRAAITERAECESLETILSTWPSISGQGSKYSRPALDPDRNPRTNRGRSSAGRARRDLPDDGARR